MGLIDLHIHTRASDGSMTPTEIVRHAKDNGLRAIAITDHDTTDGLQEAMEEGQRIGVEVIPGVEIGVDHHPEMHILGYFPQGGYDKLEETLSNLRLRRKQRNPKIIAKLNEMGFEISMSEVEEISRGNIIGRPHIAQIMVNKGFAKNMKEAFDKYLAVGKPAYFL